MNNTEVSQASRAQPAPERPSRSGWKRLVKAAALVVALLLAYLAFWPAPIDPVAYEPPANPPLAGPLAPNDRLQSAVIVAAGQVDGPEDVEVDAEGRIYTGTADGWIVRVEPDGSVKKFAKTGGRPLGIALDAQGNLIVADGVKGLLSIAPDKTVTTLVPEPSSIVMLGLGMIGSLAFVRRRKSQAAQQKRITTGAL